MMNKQKSTSLSLTKYVLLIPLVTVLVVTNHAEALAKKVEKLAPVLNVMPAVNLQTDLNELQMPLTDQKSEQSKEVVLASINNEKEKSPASTKSSSDETIYSASAPMPQFPGGEKAMYKFIGENIKYPADAQLNGITGTVFIQLIISKTGEISDVSLLRGIASSCDNEALRVVKLMPKWIPGKHEGQNINVKYILPIHFALDRAPKKENLNASSFKDNVSLWADPKNGGKAPLVIVDGKVSSRDKMDAIDVNKIKSISVLKDDAAIKAYGDKAKNGVIIVELIKE